MNVIELPSATPKPTKVEQAATARHIVVTLRRHIRKLAALNELEYRYVRQLRRCARMREAEGNWFDSARINRLEGVADASAANCRRRVDAMKTLAETLMAYSPAIDAATTLSERCDLLNINVADRDGLTDEDGIVRLIHLHGLEDSATYRGRDVRGGPLNDAMTHVFIDFLTQTPGGQELSDSLFEPGGLFESVPRYHQRPDGSLARLPPRLRLIRSEPREKADTGVTGDARGW